MIKKIEYTIVQHGGANQPLEEAIARAKSEYPDAKFIAAYRWASPSYHGHNDQKVRDVGIEVEVTL